MKINMLRFLILMGLFKVALCAFFGRNYYVDTPMTWSDAREYCRKKYTEMSSINNLNEDEAFLNFSSSFEEEDGNDTWIGLYKDANDTWTWSGGTKAFFFNWNPQDKNNKPTDNRCAVYNKAGWEKKNCKDTFPIYCFYSNLLLVKQNMTWEDALEHCRSQDMELVSLPSESALVEALQTSRTAQTDLVWTSLRYLADSWLWVDEFLAEPQAKNQMEMPQCPTWTHRCGALSLTGQQLDSWDCADRLNFICYCRHCRDSSED